MFQLELSLIDIVLTVAVFILILLYVTLVIRLKPSTKNKDQYKKDLLPKNQEPPRNGLVFVNSLKTKEKTTPPQRTQTQINPHEIQHLTTNTVRLSAPLRKNQEAQGHVVRAENRSSNSDCVHHFGYLRELPKSTSIPSECLGCHRVVECLTTLKVAEKMVKSHVT